MTAPEKEGREARIRPAAASACAALMTLYGFAASAASAQGLSINADVDKNVVNLNDQVVLRVAVSGDQTNVPDPQLPSMPNFTVYSSGRSENINFINGKVSSSVVYTYVLVPRFPGKVAIGPISVEAGGKRIATSPIEIQVVRPGQGAQPQTSPPRARGAPPSRAPPSRQAGGFGPDVYVTASLDKPKAYVNEQVTLTVRFYTSVSLLGNPQYVSPLTQGFLSEDLPPERHGETTSGGRLYHYSEIKTALFPAQSGRLTIGPAKVLCQVQSEIAVDPFAPDFFQKFFSQGLMTAQTRELKTDSLTLQVNPLPEAGKPESFTGAVGDFRISGGVDRREVKVGEAVTLALTLEGEGNLKSLGAPKLPELSAFRVFDTLSSMSLNKERDIVHGSKTFKTVLVPRASGRLTIPSSPYSYFNPSTGEYVKAGSAPLEIQVAPGAPAKPATGFVAQSGSSPDLTTVTEDIRYVKETDQVARLSSLLASVGRSLWPHAIPLGLFLLSLGVGQYRERLSLDPAGARFRSALSKAKRRVKDAQALAATEPARAAELLSGALAGFLADKLNGSPYGLTLRDAQALLRARFPKLPEDGLARLRSVWEDLEQLRFAGDGAADPGRTDALVGGLDELLQKLERELRR